MKTSEKIYITICATLISAIVIFGGFKANAQQEYKLSDEEIRIHFKVYLDNELIEAREGITIELYNETRNQYTSAIMGNNFDGFFKYDRKYLIAITSPGYQKKTLLVNTYCPKGKYDISANFYLHSNNEPVIHLGTLAYDNDLKQFTSYK